MLRRAFRENTDTADSIKEKLNGVVNDGEGERPWNKKGRRKLAQAQQANERKQPFLGIPVRRSILDRGP